MFPSPGDEIYRNEAGEPTGWGKPADAGTYWCDDCGYSHADGDHAPDPDDDDDDPDDGPGPDEWDGPPQDDEPVTLHFRGFPPIKGTGPVIVEVPPDPPPPSQNASNAAWDRLHQSTDPGPW